MAQPVLSGPDPVGEISLCFVPKNPYRRGVEQPKVQQWVILARPHVRIRLKNMFGGIAKHHIEQIHLTYTDEVCRDLYWFMQRYPLSISDEDRAALESGAHRHAQRDERVIKILRGDFQLPTTDMVLPARPYQEQAAALVLQNHAILLVDELGLGKSCTAIRVMCDPKALPALCVVPSPLTFQWRDQLRKFMPQLRTHIVTQGKPYDLRDKDGNEPHVVIMSYHRLAGWVDELMEKIRYVVFDEVQELRTGHTGDSPPPSKKNLAAKNIAMGASYRIGLTATPIYNYGGELWNLLDVLTPGILGEQDEFLREWCVGSGRKAVVSDAKALGSFLRGSGAMLRRTRDDVGRQLPPVTTVIHEVSGDDYDKSFLDPKSAAAELAKIVLDRDRKVLERGHAGRQLDILLRQATGVGKAPQVAAFVRMLLEQETDKVVLFGWHRSVYDIWAELLADQGVVWYTGSESVTKKRTETRDFLEGKAKVLMMSLRAGLGLDGLQEKCATAVFGELDWTHGVHEQCTGRLHRDGQSRPVFAYYVISDSGSDPIVCDVLGLKASQLHELRDPDGSPLTSKKAEAKHITKLAEAYLRQIGQLP